MTESSSYMSLIDWVILVVPVVFVMWMGFRSRRYIRGVSDYLACGRVCGRYVLSMGDVANALSIIGLVTYIEIKYTTGFALGFWTNLLTPLSMTLTLTGYCVYRFRETRAMSLGQFLEMRYSRPLRIFAAGLRSLAEMLANMIMPAVAARFFIQMLDLPAHISLLGLQLPTFECLMLLFLTLAITLICLGGTLALVVTDTIQGMILCPLLVCFIIFILCKFSWSGEIIPVMTDRVPGESFLNPMDVSKLRDFNFFTMVIVVAFNCIFHMATWIGHGASCAAKSAHEQKMAQLFAGWRLAIVTVFYLLVAACLITFLNHKHFAKEANGIRQALATRAVDEVVKDAGARARLHETIAAMQPIVHEIGVDAPLSRESNPDTQFLERLHGALKEAERQNVLDAAASSTRTEEETRHALIDAEGRANDQFQQCRTLFTQLNLSATMRALLPGGLFGAFCLLLFLAMLSTDDTRIFSATLTIAQDCVLPFFPKGLSPKAHVRMIRLVAIGIGVFFFFGSKYMAQLDYIALFTNMAVAIWNAGCCPVMIFGLYWKKGTTQAAWTALLAGIVVSVCYILLQRNWADVVYPFLAKHDMVDFCDRALRLASRPYGTWIEWRMDPVKIPVNAIEFLFFSNIFTIALYAIVSLATCKADFNMDRMLHRGAYADGATLPPPKRDWSVRGVCKALLGITPEYTKGDRAIAYAYFFHNFIYGFFGIFVVVALWNWVKPLSNHFWSNYFLVTSLLVPIGIAAVATVWFFIGGVRDLRRLFHDLESRRHVNELDDGRVEGHVSLADRKE